MMFKQAMQSNHSGFMMPTCVQLAQSARGVLIGYFLCEICAKTIFKEAQRKPLKQTLLHTEIEQNLIAAYYKQLASLDA